MIPTRLSLKYIYIIIIELFESTNIYGIFYINLVKFEIV